jgi:hypothetical protein
MEAPATESPPVAEAPAPAPAPTANTSSALPPIGAKPAAMPLAKKGEVIIDPADPKPCAGSLVPAKRGGKNVLLCKAD